MTRELQLLLVQHEFVLNLQVLLVRHAFVLDLQMS